MKRRSIGKVLAFPVSVILLALQLSYHNNVAVECSDAAIVVDDHGYSEDLYAYDSYDGYESDSDDSQLTERSNLVINELRSVLNRVQIEPVLQLISVEDDTWLNKTRIELGCRPDPFKAAERVEYRISEKKKGRLAVLEDIIEILDNKVAKKELSNVQAKIAKLSLKREKSKEEVLTPVLPEINMTYMNLNLSIEDVNVTRELEQLNATAHNETILKSMSFRDKLQLRRRLQQTEWEAKSAELFTVANDLTCEALVCESCKSLVHEYIYEIQNRRKFDANYLPNKAADIVNVDFCRNRNISQFYSSSVSYHCKQLLNYSTGHANVFFQVVNRISDLDSLPLPGAFHVVDEKVCTVVGSCLSEDFTIRSHPVFNENITWTSECTVCQSYASLLQARVILLNPKYLIDSFVQQLIETTCDYLPFESEAMMAVCKSIYSRSAKQMTDLLWTAKLLGEQLLIGNTKNDKSFADALCEASIDGSHRYCEKYISPEKLQEHKAVEEIEQVFE